MPPPPLAPARSSSNVSCGPASYPRRLTCSPRPLVFLILHPYEAFLEALYRGEYPAHELEGLAAFLEEWGLAQRGQAVGFEDLAQGVAALRTKAQGQITGGVYNAGSGSQYTSNALMRAHRFKHIRLKEDPTLKYSDPVTVQMAVGWTTPPELKGAMDQGYRPKKSCPETKYQDALVKTGMTYR